MANRRPEIGSARRLRYTRSRDRIRISRGAPDYDGVELVIPALGRGVSRSSTGSDGQPNGLDLFGMLVGGVGESWRPPRQDGTDCDSGQQGDKDAETPEVV